MKISNWAIDVKHLGKSFDGRPAVIDVSMQVKKGEIFGFIGPNGAGKTTTIRMICGLLTPDEGEGTCMGYDILTQSREIKYHIGYIPQTFGLYKDLTIYENLEFIAELYGLVDRKIKIKNTLHRFGLESVKNHVAGTLSGGWKQRLLLAAALIHEPLLLLLDEPTSNVDPNSRRDFWEFMHNLSAEGMTILLSSHNMDEVERCHRIAYIADGKLLMSGDIKNFIAHANLVTWHVKGNHLGLLAKQLEETPGIEQVITFFEALYISSTDENTLMKAITPFLNNPNYKWERSATSLEDVFVWLSKHQ